MSIPLLLSFSAEKALTLQMVTAGNSRLKLRSLIIVVLVSRLSSFENELRTKYKLMATLTSMTINQIKRLSFDLLVSTYYDRPPTELFSAHF